MANDDKSKKNDKNKDDEESTGELIRDQIFGNPEKEGLLGGGEKKHEDDEKK